MIITPDYKGRNDEYDENTVRYYEKIYDDWYFYELYVLVHKKKARIVITNRGVSIDFKKSGKTIGTNIDPEGLFGKTKKLKWAQLHKIIKILEKTGLEGKTHSKEEMNELYEEWKRQGKP